jgi:REP element-mobilizing transposase RayT
MTHRCHKKEFLLKFVRDRRRWLDWLFEAKKRFGLSVLNYTVTSNHIHLLVYDNNGRDAVAKSMQLIAARTGQEYNIRKQRKGTFWEDRYHATAIEKTTITINNDRYHLRDNISDYGNTPTHGNGPDARLHVETTRLLVGP